MAMTTRRYPDAEDLARALAAREAHSEAPEPAGHGEARIRDEAVIQSIGGGVACFPFFDK